MEKTMAFEPGDVVILKSGGQPMTVVSASEDDITCIWLGEEGELFRESIPAVALESLHADEDEEDEDEDEDDEEHDEDEEDEEEGSKRKKNA
jgi:uncharacterized protein YodC (DUF2158 family)